MKNVKRAIRVLAVFAAALFIVCKSQSAEASVYSSDGRFQYSLNKYDEATIHYYAGISEYVTIPAKIDGYKVVGIGDYAFSPEYNRGYRGFTLRSIVFPNTLKSIGKSAFENCDAITSVTIPDSVTHIGTDAFACCSNLANLKLGKNVETIYPRAFYTCPIKTVSFGNRIKEIGYASFADCTQLTKVTIPVVTKIEGLAFCDCTNLKRVELGNAYVGQSGSIGEKAFFNCVNLKSVYIGMRYNDIDYCAIGYYQDAAHSQPALVKGFTLYAERKSSAHIYALENGIKCKQAVLPKKTSVKTIKGYKKKFKVTWKKVSNVVGYQVTYSTSKNFTSKTTKTVNVSKNKTSVTIKGLKAKKTYYVKVRTYKTINGVKVYSGWKQTKVKTK